MNTQPIEPVDYKEDGSLEVHSIFETLQGEGPLAGTPSVFVRLSGCNLLCKLCDTEYTSKRVRSTPRELVVVVEGIRPSGLVVLTGGEPFRQNIFPLLQNLNSKGYIVQIETNGIYFLETFERNIILDCITVICSPKTSTVDPHIVEHISAWKYIVEADHIHTDGLPLTSLGYTQLPARPPAGTRPENIFVQPLHTGYGWNANKANAKNQEAALASCMEFGYRLSLQQHKILNLD